MSHFKEFQLSSGHHPKSSLVKLSATIFGLLAFSGCISPQMKSSMGDYGDVYSEANNRQLLMNLARMDQGHPPYFFQMGQVSAVYSVSGSLAGGESYPSTGLWSTSGSIGASASQSPTFTFVPLSGSRFSEQLLKPLPPEIFSALVQQAFPVDVLMRLCVQSVEFDLGQTNANSNTAPSLYSSFGKKRNRAEVESKAEYEAFLRVCGFLKDLQDMGVLGLTSVSVNEPLSNIIQTNPPSNAQHIEASTNGTVWTTNQAGNWRLCRVNTKKVFTLDLDNPEYTTRVRELVSQPWYADKTSITNTLKLLSKPDRTGMSLSLAMHSPLFAMGAAAKEQRQFEVLARETGFLESLPPSQRHPVMHLRWSRFAHNRQEPVVALTYRGAYYALADEVPGTGMKQPTWNRDAFFLLLLLMAQSDVDVTKINYGQYLQLR
jgi:hypothetical protein